MLNEKRTIRFYVVGILAGTLLSLAVRFFAPAALEGFGWKKRLIGAAVWIAAAGLAVLDRMALDRRDHARKR